MPDRDQLIQEIEDDAESFYAAGRVNNITDIVLSIAAILSSLVAAVAATVPVDPRWIVATVAAVPAACASLQRVVDFRARSNWYFQFASRGRALAISLKYANAPDLEEFGQKRA